MIKSYCVLTVLSFKIRNVDIYLEKIEIGRDTSRRVKGSADNDIFSRKRSVTRCHYCDLIGIVDKGKKQMEYIMDHQRAAF